ncbi:hypothetical protein [Aminobacter sp. AP02]|uniref:hypothetical protein n=1 Tax=Aminobacter sp. AP02 TaxID=2135737 RepID=UPI000D6AF791|nr:hypothetical protein [Aminobacter sp. AP02]PWK76758.1 hypothetical protein C8K44_10184 [Aminobacter sp. AP02]
MTDDRPDASNEGAGALALAPAVNMSSWSSEPEFDLPMLAPGPVPMADQAALGEILADALFGEVIELSDLIPQLLAPDTETAYGDVTMAEVTSHDSGADVLAAMAPLAILFEEDGSSGQGTL